jgi:hypothetical protein
MVPPEQMGAMAVKVGVVGVVTFTVIVVVVAQRPAVGVNVYVVVAVLFTAGDHVPVTPLLEVVGRVMVPPEQIGAMAVNVGTVEAFTVILVVEEPGQAPPIE